MIQLWNTITVQLQCGMQFMNCISVRRPRTRVCRARAVVSTALRQGTMQVMCAVLLNLELEKRWVRDHNLSVVVCTLAETIRLAFLQDGVQQIQHVDFD